LQSRKYPTYEVAIEELSKIGKLVHFGLIETGKSVYRIALSGNRSHTLLVYADGTVQLYEAGEPYVYDDHPKVEPVPSIPQIDIYKDGVCDCKAAGRWRHVGMTYMCVKCGKPKY